MATSVLHNIVSSLSMSRTAGPRSARKADCQIIPSLEHSLHQAGFDIVEPLCIGWYNEAVEGLENSEITVNLEFPGSKTLAVLVGNCKNFWSHLTEACQSDPALLYSEDPVDQYCETAIAAAASAEQCKHRIFYSHEESAGRFGGGYVAMQRLAEVSGCAYNDSFSHLSLHPRYGPWFALRALIIFDGIEYTGQRKPRLPNPLSRQTESYVRIAVRSARTSSYADLEPCMSGAAAGSDQLTDAATDEATAEAMRRRWPKWVAVRDAPFPGTWPASAVTGQGHPWRYPEPMILYHYTGSRSALVDAVKLAGRSSLTLQRSDSSQAPNAIACANMAA